MSMTELVQIIAAMLGALGFAVLFNIRGVKLLAVSLGGGGAWALQLLFACFIGDEMLTYFLVAVVVSFYAELMARVLKSPATIFIAPCLIPLVPGAALYYTMSHALDNSWQKFMDSAISTVKIAAALAIGIIVSVVVMRFILNVTSVLKERRARTEAKN